MPRAIVSVVAIALVGCAVGAPAVDAVEPARSPNAAASDPPPRLVTDENARRIFCGAASACVEAVAETAVVDEVSHFGPGHAVTVRSDGQVIVGDARGTRRAALPEREARRLLQRVESAGAGFGLNEPRHCPELMTDMPLIAVMLQRAGRPPIIFEVCDGETFVALARMIDDAATAALAARGDDPAFAEQPPRRR